MVIQMTRKEYEAKYGAKPATTTTSAPIKMTRAEYEAKYKQPVAPVKETYGAAFPSAVDDSPVTAGLKAAGNLGTSGYGLVKNIGSAIKNVFNPDQSKNTIAGIGNIALGAGAEGLKAATGIDVTKKPGLENAVPAFDALKGALNERYGSLENLQRTATNDPVGFATDILSIIEGGASLVGKGELVNTAIGKVGSTATKPVVKTAEKVGSGIYKTGKFAVTKSTGLNADTISEIARNPKAFSSDAIAETTRAGVGGEVKTAIDSKIKELSDTGKGYNPIREGNHVVSVDSTQVANVLDSYGIKVVDVPDGAGGVKYRLKTNAESKPLSVGEKTKLEEFLNTYGTEPQYTGNSFLNTREAISNLGGYEQGNTGNLERISRDLRGVYDSAGKEQIPGLRELDEAYGPLKQELKQIKKDYLNKDGSFKDGAINKIANLTGKGKDQVLARLEEVKPGITQKIKTLKAVEDIQAASGFKVGTYERGAATVAGVMTGNIPLIVASIMAQPEIAVPLIRGYGLARPEIGRVLAVLKSNLGEVNNFKVPTALSDYVANPQVGLSVKDVSKEQFTAIAKQLNDTHVNLMQDFIDYVRLKAKGEVDPILESTMRDFADQVRLNSSLSDTRLANTFENILRIKNQLEKSKGVTRFEAVPIKPKSSIVATKGERGLFTGSKSKASMEGMKPKDLKPLVDETKKYKTTVNIQDKNDLEYLRRIFSEDTVNDIKNGKKTNWRGENYEDIARLNIISETPKTTAQLLEGKIKNIKLKNDTFYHGTNSENAHSIMQSGFKPGSSLPEDIFRGGGYGKMQSSISFAETPKEASIFSSLKKDGQIVEARLKKDARIVSIEGIEDATDLEDYIDYLNKQKIDAVYIGGGEKEIVVINPKAVTATKSQPTDLYNKVKGK